ncbi:MAG: Ig-like domain-containing protein [Fimbriimonas sp.]|nr:Ig-like domain-containing protein [Fimbriimonas sp.]
MKNENSGVGLTLLLAASFLAISCGGGGTSNVGPTVISVTPLNAATSVPTKSLITATFNTPMSSDSLNAATFTATAPSLGPALGTAALPGHSGTNQKAVTADLAGTVSFSGHTATLRLDNPMPQNTVITATIGTGVKNLANQFLAQPYVWSFTTGTNDVPPTVVSTVPAAGTTGVSQSTNVSATFGKAMNAGSFTAATFSLKGTDGLALQATIACANNVVTLMPTSPLSTNTLYTATITTGVKDAAGTFLASNYTWTFTTGATDTAPTVLSTIPQSSAAGVSINAKVTATFSEAMNAATINTGNFTLAANGGAPVPATVTYSNGAAVLDPTALLLGSTVYTAVLTNGVKDVAGTPMAGNYSWTFTTGSSDIAPTVVSTNPAANATGVSSSTAVSATFSEAMNAASINGTTYSLAGPSNESVSATVTFANNTASLTPNAPLAVGTKYTATVSIGAKDSAGTSMANAFSWSFTTDVPPSVISTFPVDNQTDVGVGNNPTATFNEALNPATVTTSTFILLGPGNVAVPSTVTYSNKVATLAPTDALSGQTLYTAKITTGVRDVAGSPMASNFTWTFTTGQALINLGAAGTYGVLAGSTVTNTGPTVIKGDMGVSPGTAITGFPPGTITGVQHAGDAVAAKAKADLLAAYTDASTRLGAKALAGDVSGLTFTPGLYSNSSSVMLGVGSNVTFDAKGDPGAVFILQMGSTLTTGVGSTMTLIGGAQSKNIFWSVGSSATFGVNSTIAGNVLASASITAQTGAALNGRFLTNIAAVTLDTNNVTVPPQGPNKAPPRARRRKG